MQFARFVEATHFLDNDPRLTLDERLEVLNETWHLHADQEEERQVKGDTYEGIVFTRKKYAVIGGICGMVYGAELHSEKGRMHMSFIVEPIYNGVRMSMN